MDFDELFDSDLPWELLEKELEKKRLQKLVEESDIELTKVLFHGDEPIREIVGKHVKKNGLIKNDNENKNENNRKKGKKG
jgi:hypothetical protein